MDFLKIIILTIFTCSSYFEMIKMMKIESDTTGCSELIACGACTEKSFCNWSLERQTCVNATSNPGKWTVINRANCPSYSLASSRLATKDRKNYFTYKTMVSNDVNGFMDLLSRTTIQCDVAATNGLKKTLKGRVNGSLIVCDPINVSDLSYNSYFTCFIKFNGVILRFDRTIDHYVGINSSTHGGMSLGDDRCASPKADKDCVTCVWNDRVYLNTFRTCLKSNPCFGKTVFFNRRHVQNYTLASWESPAAFKCPADVDVLAVEPTRARWNGKTRVTITVKNHRVLCAADGDSKCVSVTVAGHACDDPRTVGRDSVECTVDATGTDSPGAGPVVVTYQFPPTGGLFKLTSRQTVGWRYPEVVGSGPACGPLEGGTVLTIDGSLLSSGDVALVTAGENRTCEIVSRADDRIACRTGRAEAPAAHGVTVTFDGWLTRRVPGAAFEYVAYGPALDARQRLGGIVSGGTSLPVRGARLRCAENPRAYVEHFGVRAEAGCRVLDDSHMECRTPRLDARLHDTVESATAARFGVLADFAGRAVELSPGPDSPVYFLYPDPQLAGFEVVDGAVVLYGNDLGAGYRPDDVVVRSRRSAQVCNVTRMTRDRIECEPTASAGGDPKDLRQIVVGVGDSYLITLQSRNGDSVDDSVRRCPLT